VNVRIKKILGWDLVLNSARTTVNKEDINKEPSNNFKKEIIIAEHSPIRNLTYEIIFDNIPYWVAMHLRTHHNGFKSSEDDLYFISTQRTDRTNINRNEQSQNTPVRLKIIANAHSLINISKVRLCYLASSETRKIWESMINELANIDPIVAQACVKHCVYRSKCPEGSKTCKYTETNYFNEEINNYHSLFTIKEEEKPLSNLDIFKKLALSFVLIVEGHISHHVNDKGGLTNFGITQETYNNFTKSNKSVRNITMKEVEDIYYSMYWLPGRCDRMSKDLAIIHFDSCVNHGINRAAQLLQDIANVKIDGIIGPKTLEAISNIVNINTLYINRRNTLYDNIVKSNPSQSVFLRGWKRRIEYLKLYIEKQKDLETIKREW